MPFSVSGHIFPNPFYMKHILLLIVSWVTREAKALGRKVAHYRRNLGSPEVIYCRKDFPAVARPGGLLSDFLHIPSSGDWTSYASLQQLFRVTNRQVILPGGWKCCTTNSTGEHLRESSS